MQLIKAKGINFYDCETSQIVDVISEAASGNTLSIVFLVEVCVKLKTLEDLQNHITVSSISSGVEAYYDYLWKKSKESVEDYISYTISVCLATLSQPITSEKLIAIFPEYKIVKIKWIRILSKLFPIVTKNNGGYQVFHNDFRIFLEKYIDKESDEYIHICSNLADYVFGNEDEQIERHINGFKFLKAANRKAEIVMFFTVDYVLEAIALERPMHEIVAQLEECLELVRENDIEFKTLVSFGCAMQTLSQYLQSAMFFEMPHIETRELSGVLSCEYGNFNDISVEKLRVVFQQIEWLISEGKIERAKSALDNWFGHYTPFSLITVLFEKDVSKKEFSDYLNSNKDTLIKWGELSYALGISSAVCEDSENDDCQISTACFNNGWLRGIIRESPRKAYEWLKKEQEQGFCAFNADIEEIIFQLLNENCIDLIELIAKNINRSNWSLNCRLRLAFWCILNEHSDWCEEIVREVLEKRLDLVPKYSSRLEDNTLENCSIVFFIMIINGESAEFKSYNEVAEKVLGYQPKQDVLDCIKELLNLYIGFAKAARSGNIISSDDLKFHIDALFDEHVRFVKALGSTRRMAKLLFSPMHSKFANIDDDVMKLTFDKIKATKNTDLVDILFEYLCTNNQREASKLVEIYVNKLHNNKLWEGNRQRQITEFDFRHIRENAKRFVSISEKHEVHNNDIERIKVLLKFKKIEYSGSDDYSLYDLLSAFKTLDLKASAWIEPSISLLNLSEYASNVGDNRAQRHIRSAIRSLLGRVKNLVPTEFDYDGQSLCFNSTVEYPNQEYIDATANKTYSERFGYVLDYMESENTVKTDSILSFYHAENKNPEYNYDHLLQLVEAFLKNRDVYLSFYNDDSERLWEELYPILKAQDRKIIRDMMFSMFDCWRERNSGGTGWVYLANKDFANWVRWNGCLQSSENRIFAFNELYQTHMKWVTANGIIQFEGKYKLPKDRFDNASWTDICDELSKIIAE